MTTQSGGGNNKQMDLTTILASAKLAETTKRNYITTITSTLKKLQEETKTPNLALYTVLKNPDAYYPLITKLIPNIRSRNTVLGYLMSIIRHAKDDTLAPMREKWLSLTHEVNSTIQKELKEHKASEKQKQSAIRWEDVLHKLRTMVPGSKQYLLLCMYVHFTRRQADFASVRIYREKASEPTHPCYVHLNPPNEAPYIYIGIGKTIKHYGPYRATLPTELIRAIEASLRRDPRDFVFGDKKPEVFKAWCNDNLRRIFNNPYISVNSLRHSRASYIHRTGYNMTMAEREALATMMGHSFTRQQLYDLDRGEK